MATGEPKKIVEFQSWGEMLDYVAAERKAPAKDNRSRDSESHWAGSPSFSAAVNLARTGWESAEKQARKLSDVLFNKVSSLVEREHVNYDVEGLDIDMGAYTRGEPECWMRLESHTEEGEGKRIVRIVFNGFFSSGVTNDVIIARGATVAALVELLEFAGMRTEVIHHCPFNATIHFKTLIKSADQPLDMSRLMFAVGHPSMFRRIMFAALERNPEDHQHVSCYGSPFDLSESCRGDVYLGCMSYGDAQWTSPERAEEWVIKELRKQGVEVNLDKQVQ